MENTMNRVNNAPADPQRVITGNARLSYVHVHKPRKSKDGLTEKYSVTILIPKTDIATMQRINSAIETAAQWSTANKWNGARPQQLSTPIHDGDGVRPGGEAFGEECKGHWVMTASSEAKPEIVDANCNPVINQTQVYSGIYGRVSIRFFGYLNSGKKGVGAALGNIQKTADGEALSMANVSADQDFGVGAAPWTQSAPAYQTPPYVAPAAPQSPAYMPTQPAYGVPAQPQYLVQGYPQQPYQAPVYPQQPAIDPITGMPVGGIKGIN